MTNQLVKNGNDFFDDNDPLKNIIRDDYNPMYMPYKLGNYALFNTTDPRLIGKMGHAINVDGYIVDRIEVLDEAIEYINNKNERSHRFARWCITQGSKKIIRI